VVSLLGGEMNIWIIGYLVIGLFLFFGSLGVYASKEETGELKVIIGLFVAFVFLWPFTLFGSMFYEDKK
jgi:predicted membrane protein